MYGFDRKINVIFSGSLAFFHKNRKSLINTL
jgi:hypothetical protein